MMVGLFILLTNVCSKGLIKITGFCGYLGIHVGDVLSAGRGHDMIRVWRGCVLGSPLELGESAMEKTVQNCGCELKQEKDFTITVHQQQFALVIEEFQSQLKGDSRWIQNCLLESNRRCDGV